MAGIGARLPSSSTQYHQRCEQGIHVQRRVAEAVEMIHISGPCTWICSFIGVEVLIIWIPTSK